MVELVMILAQPLAGLVCGTPESDQLRSAEDVDDRLVVVSTRLEDNVIRDDLPSLNPATFVLYHCVLDNGRDITEDES